MNISPRVRARVRAHAANGDNRDKIYINAFPQTTYHQKRNRDKPKALKMTTAIDRIRSKNKPVAKTSPEKTLPANPFTKNLPTMTDMSTPTLADHPATELPPPIPCPICDCPAIWSSIYEPQAFRCCDCDPPPGGNDAWHFQRGGWGFVARRLWIVVYADPTTLADRPEWESLPRTDWNEELRLMRER